MRIMADVLAEDEYGSARRLAFVLRHCRVVAARTSREPSELALLDVGCGTGVGLTRHLHAAGLRVTGVDTHEPSVAYGRKLLGSEGPELLVTDAGRLVEEGRRFDVVVCSEVLEHLAEPLGLLSTLRDLLLPGGRMVVTVPNGYGWFELDDWVWKTFRLAPVVAAAGVWRRRFLKHVLRRRDAYDDGPVEEPTSLEAATPHVQSFTMRKLEGLAAEAGLRVVERRNAAVLCGKLVHSLVGGCGPFIRANAWFADRVPSWMAARWFLALEP